MAWPCRQGHRLAEAASLRGEDLADEVMMVRRHCEVLAETSRYFPERSVRPAFSYRGSQRRPGDGPGAGRARDHRHARRLSRGRGGAGGRWRG